MSLAAGAVAGWEAIDTLKAQLGLARHAEMLHTPIGRIGEVDRAILADDDVVGRIEFAAPEMAGHHLARAVPPEPGDRRSGMFANQQVEFGIVRHPVALARGFQDFRDPAVAGREAPAHIRRHI